MNWGHWVHWFPEDKISCCGDTQSPGQPPPTHSLSPRPPLVPGFSERKGPGPFVPSKAFLKMHELGMVLHAYDASTWEAEAEEDCRDFETGLGYAVSSKPA